MQDRYAGDIGDFGKFALLEGAFCRWFQGWCELVFNLPAEF